MRKATAHAVKMVGLSYAVIGFIYAAAIGYFTHTTASKLVDAAHSDQIRNIETVSDTDDVLKICVEGTLAGDVLRSRYQISFPLAVVSGPASSPAGGDVVLDPHVDLSGLDTYVVSRDLVQDECDENRVGPWAYPPTDIEVPAANVMAAFEASNFTPEPSRVYEATVYWRDAREQRTYTNQKEILYAYETSEGDVEIVRITTAALEGKGSLAWAFVLPFAVAADVVSYPVQIIRWMDYGSAH